MKEETVTVEVTLFGPLRAYLKDPKVILQVPLTGCIGDIRKQLGEILRGTSPSFPLPLLNHSAIGNETRILTDAEPIGKERSFAILPPVAGG